MSDHVSQPTDADALRRAVRPLRLTAASFVDPLGALSLSLAAAETVQTELFRELPLTSFTPFGALPNTPARPDHVAAQPPAGRSAPRPAASPGARSTSHSMLGELLAGIELDTKPAPTGAPDSRADASPGRPSGSSLATLGELLAEATAPPATERATPRSSAGRTGANEATPMPAKSSASAPPLPSSEDGIAGTLRELGSRAAAVGATAGEAVVRLAGPAPSLGQLVAEAFNERPVAAAPRARVSGADASEKSLADAMRLLVADAAPAAGIAGAAAAVGNAATLAAQTAAALTGRAVNGAGPLENLGRALLDGQLGPASGAGAAPRAPQRTVPAPVPIPHPNLAAQPPAAPELEPGDLAWLVNEALIEQARRHGVDLS